jgi:ACR3 family arsenite transporter
MTMWNILSALQKNLVWSIPASMLLGLLCGYLFDAAPLRQLIIPVTFIMVYPMMVTLNVQSIFKGRDTALQLATQAVNFILIPLLAYYTGRFFSPAAPKNTRCGPWGSF